MNSIEYTVIVGLGNIGANYAFTPHNVGFMVVDAIAKKFDIKLKYKSLFDGFFANFILNHKSILLLKPSTYMNLSGKSVFAIVQFYKVQYDNIIIINDDLDLPLGILRIKHGSSSGGHKGVQSIIDYLGSNAFTRVKIGIGRDGDPSQYVLRRFNEKDFKIVKSVIDGAKEAIFDIISHGYQSAMNHFNNKSFSSF